MMQVTDGRRTGTAFATFWNKVAAIGVAALIALAQRQEYCDMFSRSTDTVFPFGDLRREIARLLDGFETHRPGFNTSGRFPAMNVWEDGEALYVEAELPGVKQEDLEILVVGNELTIKGRRERVEGQDLAYHRQERGFGEFNRALTLPVEVNADNVEATLCNGVLTLRLPKSASARPRKITVSGT